MSLTLLVGALLLATGLTRLFPAPAGAAAGGADGRGVQVLSGLVSVALGLWVLLNVTTATLTLLGVLVAVQVLLEGATLAVSGRLRPVPVRTTAAGAPPADRP